jgi:hypothetical protein
MKFIAKTLLLSGLFPSLAYAQATQIIIYQAFTQANALNPHLIVAQRYKGNCSSPSVAVPGRNDTWQCQACNMTFDPCFQDDVYVVCTVSPWSDKVAVLQLNTPLNKSTKKKINLKSEPWGIELTNGARCTFLTGASTMIANERINYSCNPYVYSIVGKIDRSSPIWKANVFNYDTKQIQKMPIKRVWF